MGLGPAPASDVIPSRGDLKRAKGTIATPLLRFGGVPGRLLAANAGSTTAVTPSSAATSWFVVLGLADEAAQTQLRNLTNSTLHWVSSPPLRAPLCVSLRMISKGHPPVAFCSY